jgi:putative transposase
MPRTARVAPGGLVYHVLNRAVARLPLFEKRGDYEAFERVLGEAQQGTPTRILAYCVMPNHSHFVLWPKADDELTAFVRWLTQTHTMRWHAHHHTRGTGHLYQGRFKSFPVQSDEHLYTVLRYVEHNAVRARLVRRAENWMWSSVWRRTRGNSEAQSLLSSWPIALPDDWLARVNQPLTEQEIQAIRHSVTRGTPFGAEVWRKRTAGRLGLNQTLRPRGRPRKPEK